MSDNDDRIIKETGVEARIAQIIAPALRGGGFRLVRIRLTGQNGLTLQLLTGDDSVSACGTWSCPDFFEAFAEAVQ